jgi:hypothetical protein
VRVHLGAKVVQSLSYELMDFEQHSLLVKLQHKVTL